MEFHECKTLVFYYHYNQSIGSDGDVILKSKDWPYTEAEWLAGAGASNPTCAVYQLYDSNGVKLDYQLRTYYYSPNADKLNNSLSIANYWQIEEVRIMPLDGKPAKKQKFDYTAPDNFSQVSGTTADDPTPLQSPGNPLGIRARLLASWPSRSRRFLPSRRLR